ncbi:MAG: DUF484 family protein [Rubrivivax sp.]|nr:DUF484 family protein [Rubrivivax sp.]
MNKDAGHESAAGRGRAETGSAAETAAAAPSGEAEIAAYLARSPGFFERHAELLASIRLTSPHGQRAVTLSERQMEMLRERIRGLELKIVEMIRAGQENMALVDRLHRFTRALMRTADPVSLPGTIVATLQHEFLVPQVAVRLWALAPGFAASPFAGEVSDDVKAFAGSLSVPYCGVNAGFEAVGWLDEPGTVASVAMIPLRQGRPGEDDTFGLLVLGSPDPTRYSAEMGTEFLVRVGELAAAALARLRLPGGAPA